MKTLYLIPLLALSLSSFSSATDYGPCENPYYDPESPESWKAFWTPKDVAVEDERGTVPGVEVFLKTNHCRFFGPFDVRPADPEEVGDGWMGGFADILAEISPYTPEVLEYVAPLTFPSDWEGAEYDPGM